MARAANINCSVTGGGKRIDNSMAQGEDEVNPGLASDESLFAAIRSAAPDGSHIFLRDSGGRQLTYGEMFAETGRIANCLWTAGLRPGDRLAVQVEKSVTALLLP